jgi:hypothetical protein
VLVTAWDACGKNGQATGTVRIPQPLPTPTRSAPTLPTQTAQIIPTYAAIPIPTRLPAMAPGSAHPQMSPSLPVIDPVYFWPFIGLLGLMVAFSSSSWSDKRHSAIYRLEKLLKNAASGHEETKKSQTENGENK